MEYYQQGDVLIKKINKLPDNAFQIKTNVLVTGELTGHAHRVDNRGKVFKHGNRILPFLVNDTDYEIEIIHEEHHTIKIPPGIFKIDKVKEYDHFVEEVRQVRD